MEARTWAGGMEVGWDGGMDLGWGRGWDLHGMEARTWG